MSLDVPIRKIDPLEKSEVDQSRLVQSQEVYLNRKFVEQADSIDVDSEFLAGSDDSVESSSVFNSENDRPVSKSSDRSSEKDDFVSRTSSN